MPIVAVRQSLADPYRWFFDFDPVAPGGRGGAGVVIHAATGLASIDGVVRNTTLPPRSTGRLLADGLAQTPLPKPLILEAWNVENSTAISLSNGSDGQGTRIGKLLEDVVSAVGGTIVCWEPVRDGGAWHLRVHLTYP